MKPRTLQTTARKLSCLLMLNLSLLFTLNTLAKAPSLTAATRAKHIIIFIWDGLRPDSISAKNTPMLYQLKQQGVWFSHNHSSYPTITMVNAASFAAGASVGKTGFYGNTLWQPHLNGSDASGQPIDFNTPTFTEDYKVLLTLNRPQEQAPLLAVDTLFDIAHKAEITTATIGKSGPAFMQDYKQNKSLSGIIIDEKHVYPLELAKQMLNAGYPLPKNTVHGFAPQALPFDNNLDPTAFDAVKTLKVISGESLGLETDFIYPDNVTPDPSATQQSPYNKSNRYLMQTYLTQVLAQHNPTLSVIWLRDPDTTEHNYGVGSPSYYTALKNQDRLLGQLLTKLNALNLRDKTDLIIASDHSHSNVSGPLQLFPLRFIHNGIVSVPDINGYSSSGDFRPADLLSRAGFHAYDGHGCEYDPVLSGIKADSSLVYPIQVDKSASICQKNTKMQDNYGHRHQLMGRIYTTPSYKIPHELPQDAIIVANNGGSTYLYVVNHTKQLVKKVVRYLQSRQEFGAIFIADAYGEIPGTLPMSVVHIQKTRNTNPDIIVGSNYDDNVSIRGIPGIEFNSCGPDRGMHGSFSRTDVHNTLIAIGKDFKQGFEDSLPTGNIDLAPTIAYLLKLKLPKTDGRILFESLKNSRSIQDYAVINLQIKPNQPAYGLSYQLATNPDGKDLDRSKSKYSIDLQSTLLLIDGKSYTYFDFAKSVRY